MLERGPFLYSRETNHIYIGLSLQLCVCPVFSFKVTGVMNEHIGGPGGLVYTQCMLVRCRLGVGLVTVHTGG